MVQNLPVNVGDTGSIPGWEDPLEKEMATHSSILFFFFFLNLFFNLRKIALLIGYCIGFCHTATQISHNYTYTSLS